MRIVFSTDQLYKHGGIERVLCQKASYLADVLNYEVYIVTTGQRSNPVIYPISANVNLVDLDIQYNSSLSYFSVRNLLKIPRHLRRLKQFIHKVDPVRWVVCNFSVDFFFMPNIFRKNLYKEYHGSQFERVKWDSPTWLQKRILNVEKKYSKLILLNEYEASFFETLNTHIIPNAQPLSSKNAKFSSRKIIALGRIADIKGFDRLISIFGEILKEEEDVELHIYGQNYLHNKEKLLEQIEKQNIQDYVKLFDPVHDVEAVLSEYSIYAMTSHSECFPMVLLEAQALGLPAVAYDVPTGPKAIISNERDGFLVRDGDFAGFKDRLLLLLRDEDLWRRMSANAKMSVKRFDVELVMNRWDMLFRAKENK